MTSQLFRSHLTKLSLIGLISLAAASSVFSSERPPNILLITVDDLNDWIEPMGGHPDAKTPAINKFSESGAVVFRNAVCPAPVCGPSRSSFLSGYMPHTTGIYDNGTNMLDSPIVQKNLTMPEYFARHGYYTLSTGKVFHSHRTKNGEDKGQWAFENYYASSLWDIVDPDTLTSSADNLIDGKKPGDLKNDVKSTKDLAWGYTQKPDFEDTKDYAKVEWASQYLNGSKPLKEPFFMAVGIYKPHYPWFVPKEFFDLHDLDEVDVPHVNANDLDDIKKPNGGNLFSATGEYTWVKEHGLLRKAARAYLAAMSEADASLDVILSQLSDSEYADNTIVVIMGDHGWHLGEKLRYHKNTLWAESVKTPLLVRTPQTAAAFSGLTYSDNPVNLVDVFPTLVELSGIPEKDDLDGVSFNKMLLYPESDAGTVGVTVGSRGASVLNKRWHLIENRSNGHKVVTGGEFYDLLKDPYEENNLIDSTDPEIVAAIKNMSQHLPQEYTPSVKTAGGRGPKKLDETIKPLRQKL